MLARCDAVETLREDCTRSFLAGIARGTKNHLIGRRALRWDLIEVGEDLDRQLTAQKTGIFAARLAQGAIQGVTPVGRLFSVQSSESSLSERRCLFA